jgi:glycogen(starch) synthase
LTCILVVTNFYPPHHYGGYELSCRDVVERWRLAGHRVVVLTSDRQVTSRSAAESRADVRRDLKVYLTEAGMEPWPLKDRYQVERHNLQALRAAVTEVRPDVVSVWHMAGISLSLLNDLIWRRCPTVCVVCDEWPAYVPRMDPWNRTWRFLPTLGQRVVRRVTGIPGGVADAGQEASFCFVSHALRDGCLKRSPWNFPRSTVSYSGIDSAAFPPVAPLARPWSWDLVSAGRLDRRKGFSTAVAALPLLPRSATLQILSAADSAHRAELDSLATSLGVRGRLSFASGDRELVRRRFSEAGAVLFPSAWDEPFGLVPVEAMACSTPVVATGTGGSSEFLNDGVNCLRFRPRDPGDLASTLIRLSESAELRQQLVSGGAATAGALTADRLARFLETWHLAAADGFVAGVPGPPLDMRVYADRGV